MNSMLSKQKTWMMLAFILAAGLALRVYVLVTSRGYVDGDEALVGLQSLDILRGHHSVFFAGELLAGSIEAYLVAPVFWVFGASPYTLRVVPLLFSLGFILLNYYLAERVFGHVVGLLSASLVAICPLVLTVLSLKTWGGYIETATIGEGALLLTMAIVSAKPERSSPFIRLGVVGFLSGFATWMHPLYFYFLFTVGLVLLIFRFRRSLRELVVFAIAFFAGCAPLWIGYLWSAGGPSASSVAGLVPLKDMGSAIVASVAHLGSDALPTVWGLRPIRGEMHFSWAWVVVPVYLASVLYAVRRQVVAVHARGNADGLVLLVFLALSPFIFVLGAITNGNYTTIIPGSGLLSRYYVPAYTVLAIFAAAAVWASRRWLRWLPAPLMAMLLAVNLLSNLNADRVDAMRSPYENVPLPATNSGLVEFLQAEGIHYAYTTHWIGYRLMFDTEMGIQTSDFVEQQHGMDRLPRFSEAVEQSEEIPAFILFYPHWNAPVPFEARLQEIDVSYSRQIVQDYVVYYDLSRRVNPAEMIETLVWPYWYS